MRGLKFIFKICAGFEILKFCAKLVDLKNKRKKFIECKTQKKITGFAEFKKIKKFTEFKNKINFKSAINFKKAFKKF